MWFLPVNRKAFPGSQGRYPESTARASYYLLNAGLLLRLFAEPAHVAHASSATSIALIAAAVFQLGGIAAAASIVWQRVYAPPLRPNA